MSASSAKTGNPAPVTATQAGATDPDGNIQPLLVDADGSLLVDVASGTIIASNPSVGPTGSAVPADATYVGGINSGNLVGVKVASDGTVAVSAATLPLPTGAATEATLSTLNGKVAACNTGAVVVASGSITAVQPTGSNLHVAVDSMPTTTVTGTVAATQSGTWNITNVSGTVSLPTGAATESTLSTLNGKVTACNTGAVVISSGSVTVSGTVAATQSGAWSLSANQSVNVSQINAVTPLMGNGVTGTGSQRVTIASDNTAFTVNNQVIGQSGSTNANSSLASSALEASHVIKASAGRLFQLTGVNTKTSAQYIQVFNSTTVPADSTAPVLLAYVPAGANFSFDFGAIGRYFSTGIAVSNSSTAATKTIGSADCWFNAEYL